MECWVKETDLPVQPPLARRSHTVIQNCSVTCAWKTQISRPDGLIQSYKPHLPIQYRV